LQLFFIEILGQALPKTFHFDNWISDDDISEVADSLGMSEKPLHVARFVKVLAEWQSNPQSFANEIDNFDQQAENNIKIKKNAARGLFPFLKRTFKLRAKIT